MYSGRTLKREQHIEDKRESLDVGGKRGERDPGVPRLSYLACVVERRDTQNQPKPDTPPTTSSLILPDFRRRRKGYPSVVRPRDLRSRVENSVGEVYRETQRSPGHCRGGNREVWILSGDRNLTRDTDHQRDRDMGHATWYR